MIGNYIKGSIFLNKAEIAKYNNILSVTKDYIPCVLLGSEYCADMRELHDALEAVGVEHILIDPLAERGIQMQHCFVASERANEIAKDAYDRMINYILERTQ